MYLTILEKNILNPVYLRRIGLMNSSEQKSNLRCSVFLPFQTKQFCIIWFLGPFSVQRPTVYCDFWFVKGLATQHKNNDFVLTEIWWRQKDPPLLVPRVYWCACQKLVLPKYLRVFSSNNSFKVIFTQEYSPVARLWVAGLCLTDGGGDPHTVWAWRVVPRADEEWWRFAVDHGSPKCRLLCRWAGCGLVWSLRSLIFRQLIGNEWNRTPAFWCIVPNNNHREL